MGMIKQNDGWRLPDTLWERARYLLVKKRLSTNPCCSYGRNAGYSCRVGCITKNTFLKTFVGNRSQK